VSVYYQAISTFYGAILFIGFHSAFALSHFDTACENEITSLLELIDEFHRWPEVVTFEEMNQKPPLFLLTHAMRKAFPEKGAPDGILAEVRSLGSGIRRE
jgi:hypothetical protein